MERISSEWQHRKKGGSGNDDSRERGNPSDRPNETACGHAEYASQRRGVKVECDIRRIDASGGRSKGTGLGIKGSSLWGGKGVTGRKVPQEQV